MSVIVKVNGLEIKEKTLYKIVDKIDNNALDGLREFGSTKIPQEYMSNIIQCPWDARSGAYDTGFYIHSPCYNGLNEEDRKIVVSNLQEHIIKPFEQMYGLGMLDNKNFDYWANYSVDLEEGRIFNTANIKDLLDLYIAMRAFALTPKDLKGDPRFKDSQFMVEDREVTNKRRNERDINYMDALQQFFTLVSTSKHKLIPILRYTRMNGADSMNGETSDTMLSSLFKNWIDSDVSNVDNFLRVVSMTNKKAGLEEVTLYSHLLDMNKKGKVSKIGDEFVYADVTLGADLKTAAKNLATKSSLKELKVKIIEEHSENIE